MNKEKLWKMGCNCKNWKEYIEIVDKALLIKWREKSFEFKPFDYCPWCGKKVEKQYITNRDKEE